MELIVALAAAGVVVLLAVLLPIASFVRAQQAYRATAAVRERLAALEVSVARLTASAPAPAGIVPAERTPGPAKGMPDPSEPQRRAQDGERRLPEPPPAESRDGEDFEQQIGSRWLLYAGIVAVVLGMSYFVKFAFDNGWISEPLRVAAGAAIGLGLVAGGMHFWSRGLAPFGQALAGGGIVVLYVSVYAALHFYRLIAPAPAFGLMVLVTAAGAWLADRQRSQPLAALALFGGFATPLLVGGGQGAQIVLFTYIAILIGGSAAIARRHAWPLLSAGSYLCTFALVIAWFFESYEAVHWLRTELFLTLYAGLFAYLLWALLASKPSSPQSQLAVAALATAPLVYHVASVALLNAHPPAWFLYLVLITIAGLGVSQQTRAAWLRVLVLLLVSFPALVWISEMRYPGWDAAAAGTAIAVYALHLVGQWEADDTAPPDHGPEDGGMPPVDVLHAQLNGLLLAAFLYVFFDTRAAQWSPWVVGGLAAWNGALAAGTRARAPRMGLQFVTLAATLAAAATVLAFDGPAVAVGWATEGIFVGWLAMRERSRWLAFGSGALVALGSVQLMQLLTAEHLVRYTPVFNARALAAAVVIGLLGWMAVRMRADPSADVRGRARDSVIVLANLLAILLLSAEIYGYFEQRALEAGAGGAPSAADRLAGQLALSVTWALYAVGLIAAGIRRGYAPARYFAIALFGVTIAKVLGNDIAGLDRFHRMLSVLGVGVLLLVASYLYQRRSAESRRARG